MRDVILFIDGHFYFMARRPLTEQEKAAARRLKSIWDEKKRELGLTQNKARKLLGFKTQSSVSQYLGGEIALNDEAAYKFAKLLRVEPADFKSDYTPPAKLLMDAGENTEVTEKTQYPSVDTPTLLKLCKGEIEYESLAPNIEIEGKYGHGSLVIRVSDDANLPDIPRGFDALIDPTKTVELGDYGLFYNPENDGLTLAQLLSGPEGKMAVHSNSNYPPLSIVPPVTIIGRLMQLLARSF